MPGRCSALLVTLALLGACARAAPSPPLPAERDPAVAQALLAPLLSDPDLVSVDRRFMAMSDPGPIDLSLPPDDFAEPTIAMARAEAAKIAGDAKAGAAAGKVACADCDALLLSERARVLGPSCGAGVDHALAWSMKLPPALAVYPKSHLREAMGRDGGACPLRAASFTAPVPGSEVLTFYRRMAARGGYAVASAGPSAIVASRGAQRIAVIVRDQPGALSQFDLIAR